MCSVGLHAPLPHPHQDWAPPPPTHICTGTGLTLSGPLPFVRFSRFRDQRIRAPVSHWAGDCAALIIVMLLGLVMLGLAVETAVEHMVSCWSPCPLRPVPA